MINITVAIADDPLLKLKEMAERFQETPEELVGVSIEEILTRPEDTFQRTVKYVLKKNADAIGS